MTARFLACVLVLAVQLVACQGCKTSSSGCASPTCPACPMCSPPDGGPLTKGQLVCAHLSAIGCAQPETCAATYDHAVAVEIVALPGDCWLGAQTPAAAVACGGGLVCP